MDLWECLMCGLVKPVSYNFRKAILNNANIDDRDQGILSVMTEKVFGKLFGD